VKTKILFICLGNICRSPAAEAVMQSLIDKNNLNLKFELDSCGTSSYHQGEKADSRMIHAARKRGLKVISISRGFLKSDFKQFDHLIVMDDSNYENIMVLDTDNEYSSKVHKMTDFCSPKYQSYTNVPDPYYGGENGFEEVLDLLEDSCQNLLGNLNNL